MKLLNICNIKIVGDQLSSVDTGTMCNSGAAVSPCGRFVAAFGEYAEKTIHKLYLVLYPTVSEM